SAFIRGSRTKYCQASITARESATTRMRLRLFSCMKLQHSTLSALPLGEGTAQVTRGGTGSYPSEPPSHLIGWHRARRRIVSMSPLRGPWTLRASIAYCEQVGVKRHEGGRSGDRNRR